MKTPKKTLGLRHVALFTHEFEACLHFYHTLLGMEIEWQPDADNIYLTSGNDNLALHRANNHFKPGEHQRLDHIGFILASKDAVDEWHDFLKKEQVFIKNAPRDHRDGTRSFYCCDPSGIVVQMIYHPKL